MTARIARLVTDGLYREAITLYSKLNSASFVPNKFNFPFLLKACAELKDLPQAQMLHVQIIKMGFQFQVHTASALTSTYMKFSLVDNAAKAFEEINNPTVASLNAVISGFSQNGFFKEALKIFRLVFIQILRPDSVTVAGLLSGCDDVKQGVQLHCWAIKIGVELDIYAATSILTMYLHSGDIISAKRLFGLIPFKNVVCYNAYMSGLLRNGNQFEVLNGFNEMRGSSDEKPNLVTFISVASACAYLKYLRFGKQLHGVISKVELGLETKVGTALVDMYSKCGSWECAYGLFRELGNNRNMVTLNAMIAGMMLNHHIEPAVSLFMQLEDEGLKPDSTTWNSMISGFSQLGKEDEAFMFFRKMLSASLMPSMKCITSLLPACSVLSTVLCGEEIHAHVIRTRISSDEFIATALVDMYMKCGKYTLARKVFDQFRVKPDDPAFWNAMISGYGRNGKSESACEIFCLMKEENIQPNSATFNCMLSMCSHTGQVDLGWHVFRSMVVNYGLQPTSEQLNVIVDLLGRSGLLKEAQELLVEIKDPSASVFASLLGASKHYADSELGEEMAKSLLALEPNNPTPLVILSNIYSELGQWKDVERIRDIISARRLRKLPGFSMIGVT